MTDSRTYILVGVLPGQPDSVLLQAALFASHFSADLICAHVNPGRYMVDERPDGSVSSLPFDPDLAESQDEVFDPGLANHLAHLLSGSGISWSTRTLAGETARALGHLAGTLDAAMIIVGTRERTVTTGLHDFFTGSVAVHLAHRQHRPVVVIPLSPVGPDSTMPWETHRGAK